MTRSRGAGARPRTTRAALALVGAVLTATACTADPAGSDEPRDRATSVAPGPSPTSTTTSAAPTPRPRPTSDDVGLARAFVRFAARPSRAALARLDLAPDVRLGVGPELSANLGTIRARRPDAWVLDLASLGGVTGPFSAVDTVRRHVGATGSTSVVGRDAAFDVRLGEHPRCSGGTPDPPPGELAVFFGLRRVSLQPSSGSIESCLDWFSVDLFQDGEGRVVAVLLDVWDP